MHGLFENKRNGYLIQEVTEKNGKYQPDSFPAGYSYVCFGTPEQLEKIQARREGKTVNNVGASHDAGAGKAAIENAVRGVQRKGAR